MKKILLSGVLLMFGAVAFAQDLPDNPEPGKCYVRCKTPEVWKNEDVSFEVSPAYNKIIVHPAEYKTVNDRVITKEAGQELVIVPATWETKTITYQTRDSGNILNVVNAKFAEDTKTIETKAASARWEMSEKAPDCESSDPNDCRYWCYKPVPAKFTTVSLTKLISDASVSTSPTPEGSQKTYTRRVMVNPPTTKVVEVPAVYSTVKRTVLVKDAWKEEISVPAKYKTVTTEILVNKGGLTTWKEVECELINNNTLLPINWNLGSATLTPTAKRIIDTKLLPILEDGVAVAIESHTDMRGTKKNNQNLSERRAQAVTNYLISKKINPSQLTGNGFGESRLTNRCSDGVSCTEAEHRANRRTTFRVINQ
jgi:outer membrane protein OmpA-like peptidoglycan-associated protein